MLCTKHGFATQKIEVLYKFAESMWVWNDFEFVLIH